MKQHYRLTIWSLFFLITSSGSAFAQRKTITPIDSLITVGYATGSLKTISGSVEKITETQMNKDQITNPLEAIRGRVTGSDHPAWDKRSRRLRCSPPARNHLIDQRKRPADYRRWSLRRFEYAYLHLSYRHRELHHPERRFRNGTVRITRRLRCHRNHHQEGDER